MDGRGVEGGNGWERGYNHDSRKKTFLYDYSWSETNSADHTKNMKPNGID